jgi:predicted permease
VSDLRFALRALARSPLLTATALLSLAIGIGANTAIFSVTQALLLRPLPYADADRLAILWNRSPGLDIAEDWFSTAQYFDIRDGQRSFADVAIAFGANMNLAGDGGQPERVGTIRVSSNLLPMLGARAAHGRLFLPDDDNAGRAGTAVLSEAFWARRFGRDAAVVGRTLRLNGQPYEVVGVLPPGFALPREVLPTLGVIERGDVFLPLPMPAGAATIRTREDYNVVARLKPGATVAQAQAEMDALTARLRRDHPDVYPPNGGLTFSVLPLQDEVVGDVRRPLQILTAAVGFVLLIACANAANLQISRALVRRREMAVRAALGASRWRLVRQLLTESLLLSLGGGLIGVAVASAGVRWIQTLQPADVPRVDHIAVDAGVLLFTLVVSIAAGVLFGLAPALGTSRRDLAMALHDAARGSSGAGAIWRRGSGLRRLLAAGELALSVVLLIGAGLLIRSFAHLQRVAPGFDPTGVLTVEISATGAKYPNAQSVIEAYTTLYDRLRALPGVTHAGGVNTLPLADFFAWGPITVEGRVPPPGEKFVNADQRVASPGYFETMRIPLVRGRFFDAGDHASNPRAVVIDTRMADELWPGADPIGRRLKFGDAESTSPWEIVVGVAGRVKQYGLDADARMALYRPQTQSAARSMYVVVRTAGDPQALAPSVRDVIRGVDPDLPIAQVQTMAARVDRSLARRRFSMTLLTIFAGAALALAVIGIYGVMAFLVSQGTREMGIRIALGATPRGILTLVLGQGALLAAAGLAAGLGGALALTRLMRSQLFGVEPHDPITFAVIAAGLALVALMACAVPARRAARTDAIAALRAE